MTATRRSSCIALLAVTLICTGCRKERPPRPSAPPVTEAAAKPTAPAPAKPAQAPAKPDLAANSREAMDVTAEQFEGFLTAIGSCEIASRGIAHDCAAYTAYRTAKHRRGAIDRPWREIDRELAIRHLAHQDAAVRFMAAELMGPLSGATSDDLKPLIQATRREVHPGVVRSFVKRMGAATYRNDEVRELMMILAGHLDERVRIEVVSWLTSARGRGTPHILDRAMKVVTDDPSERVRLHVLEDLGDRGEDVVLPALERFLSDPERSPRGYASAARALITMWSSPVVQVTPSKAAYTRTMKLLEQTPRSDLVPPWTALGGLRWHGDARFAERAPFFDAGRLAAALDAIALDADAGWKVRKAVIELMRDMKSERARFVRLLADYTARPEHSKTDSQVMNLLRVTIDPSIAPTVAPAKAPALPIPAPAKAP